MHRKQPTENSKPLLIGLSGKARAGKSTVADYLAGRGYYSLAFADPLKEVVSLIFGFTAAQLHGDLKEEIDPRWGVSPRWCLQWLGTEVLRSRWPDFWIRRLRRDLMDLLAQYGQRRVVVTDVRFRDEAEALQRLGARLWRIERPGIRSTGATEKHRLEACATHSSETELDDYRGWDAVIINNAGVPELLNQVAYLLEGK